MDPVDQGTLAMLLFGGGMAILATLYFTVRWYYKRKSKSPPINKFKKQRLKQTFSRFSAVDEELTVQVLHEPNASDRDLIISYCESEGQATPTTSQRTQSIGRRTPTLGTGPKSPSSPTSPKGPRIQTVSLEVESKSHSVEIAQSSKAFTGSRPSYLETDL